jgi:hypothetical protein
MADDAAAAAVLAPPPQSGVLVPQSVAALGYQQLEMRKRIALQLLARQQHGYPKNIGEGLASLGNSLGDIGTMQMLLRQQQEQQAADRQQYDDAQKATPASGGVT